MARVFVDPGYRGAWADVPYGVTQQMSNLGLPAFSISSIKVQPFTKVELFATPSALGTPVATINGPIEIPDLSTYTGNPDNRTNSMRVTWMDPPNSTKIACCTGTNKNCGALNPTGTKCKEFWQSYCSGAGMKDANCKKWANDNRTLAEPLVLNFCKLYPDDPFCTCINSKLLGPKFGMNPACADAACIQTGFKTANMMVPCPTIINCEQVNNIRTAGIQIASTANTAMNCGGTETAPQEDGLSGLVLFMLFMFFIVIAAVIALVIQLTGRKAGSKKEV